MKITEIENEIKGLNRDLEATKELLERTTKEDVAFNAYKKLIESLKIRLREQRTTLEEFNSSVKSIVRMKNLIEGLLNTQDVVVEMTRFKVMKSSSDRAEASQDPKFLDFVDALVRDFWKNVSETGEIDLDYFMRLSTLQNHLFDLSTQSA